MAELNERFEQLREEATRHGQPHLFQFWDALDDGQRAELLDDVAAIDFERSAALIEPLVKTKAAFALPNEIEPPDVFPAASHSDQEDLYARAREAGEAAIRAGRVAAFTVAGGQGTRLGFDGPKGAFEISPVRNACLFRWFAEGLRGTERRYGQRPRWYIMTSPSNHEATREVFRRNSYFGLEPDDILFFSQAQMPAFSPDGEILLADRHRVALSPDGHGGSLAALSASGALANMREHGVEYISYHQVDNALVRTIDPLFVGMHIAQDAEISSKALPKVDDLERVGNFCVGDGRLQVIEYSDLPDELAHKRNDDGSRMFDAGSIAIHVLDRAFVERLTTAGSGVALPWHRAEKKVAHVNDNGEVITPEAPNAVKLEMFVFDAIPLAERSIVLMTRREEEFSPVKNAEGVDSPAVARRDLIRRAARWLSAAGVDVPQGDDGEPGQPLEVSPAFALDAEDLKAQLARRGAPLIIEGGQPLLLGPEWGDGS